MANHYIRQDLERQMILLCLTDAEIATFINVAVSKELKFIKGDRKDKENGR